MTRTALALLIVFGVSAGAMAEETSPIPSIKTLNLAPAGTAQEPTGKIIYSDATRQLSLAMCGIEGHGTTTDLDAGLIDMNALNPARAAGGRQDDQKYLGHNQYDYRSAVVLGVTVGYKF